MNFEDIYNIAIKAKLTNLDWHYHYLPPNCSLNKTNDHLLILEAADQKYSIIYKVKPLADLEKLENLFF